MTLWQVEGSMTKREKNVHRSVRGFGKKIKIWWIWGNKLTVGGEEDEEILRNKEGKIR